MINKIYKFFVEIFKSPDWMFRKDVFFLILLVPLFCLIPVVSFTIKSHNLLKNLESETLYLEKLLSSKIGVYKKEEKVRVDQDYIKNILEKIEFLEEDKRQLALIVSQVEEKDLYPEIKKRLEFIESDKNKLKLISKNKGDKILWDLESNVQMNFKDVAKLITLVEKAPLGSFYRNPNSKDIYFSKFIIKKINKDAENLFSADFQLCQKRSS